MDYEIRYVKGHVEVYCGGCFFCSADTVSEARAIMEE